MDLPELLSSVDGFEWDGGNIEKNWDKHGVKNKEAEEAFLSDPLFGDDDKKHSQNERRYYVLGQTDNKRLLYISFTIRNNKIRVISARDQNRKERRFYEKI